ncbi:MAG: manganese efflux pump MntP family protein [Bacillota bacterium]|jgi:putative Mn2+ efflux pump MntP|nr:manganese efflux pump MntP family protein [Thermoanaerobacteraceae bacterium]
MSPLAVVLLAVALGTDAFSVCLGLGLGGISRRRGCLLVFVITVFHVLMPLAGWWLGEFAGTLLGRLAGIVGAALLFFLGTRMIYGALLTKAPRASSSFALGIWGVLCLGASVSMDALSVGFALGVYRINPLLIAGVVGLVAGLMTVLGLGLGRTAGAWIGRRAQLVGGLILFIVGIQLLH